MLSIPWYHFQSSFDYSTCDGNHANSLSRALADFAAILRRNSRKIAKILSEWAPMSS